MGTLLVNLKCYMLPHNLKVSTTNISEDVNINVIRITMQVKYGYQMQIAHSSETKTHANEHTDDS